MCQIVKVLLNLNINNSHPVKLQPSLYTCNQCQKTTFALKLFDKCSLKAFKNILPKALEPQTIKENENYVKTAKFKY